MKKVALTLLLSVFLVTSAAAQRVQPVWRQKNWKINPMEGSCCHCAVIDMFYAQGRPDLGLWWFNHHDDGESRQSLNEDFADANIPVVYTDGDKNVAFLRWAVDEGIGCGVAINNRSHCVWLLEITEDRVCYLDCNSVDELKWVRTEDFLENWFSSGSWAFSVVVRQITKLPPGY